MTVKFKPYVAFGVGNFARMLTYEFDNARTLRVKAPIGGVLDTIPLEGASASRQNVGNFLEVVASKALDIGDVLISVRGRQKLCPNISGVQAFMRAVDGTHPDVQPPGPPWYSKAELEDFQLKIPAMTNRMAYLLRHATLDSGMDFERTKKPGDWVEKGEPVIKYNNGITIVSPVFGKVIQVGQDETSWDDVKKKPDFDSSNPDFSNYALRVQPIKGSYTSNVMQASYDQIIAYVAAFLNDPRRYAKFRNSSDDPAGAERRDRADLDMFRNYRAEAVPLKSGLDNAWSNDGGMA